jgi:TM2 domain-containing protein
LHAVRDQRDVTSELPSSDEPGASSGGSEGASDRSRGVTLALAFLGGVFGLHRFYTGRLQSGIWMALTFGGMGIWYLYDLILVATGEFRDGEGLRVVRWDVSDVAGYGDPSIRRVRELEGDVAALRGEVSELAERLDFAERLLAQERDRPRLPKA